MLKQLVLPQDPPSNRSAVDVLFTTKYKIGWIGGTAYLTGYALIIILAVMIICSMPFVRRKGYFQVSIIRNYNYMYSYGGVMVNFLNE